MGFFLVVNGCFARVPGFTREKLDFY